MAAWTAHLRLWVEGRKGGQTLVEGGWQRQNIGGFAVREESEKQPLETGEWTDEGST